MSTKTGNVPSWISIVAIISIVGIVWVAFQPDAPSADSGQKQPKADSGTVAHAKNGASLDELLGGTSSQSRNPDLDLMSARCNADFVLRQPSTVKARNIREAKWVVKVATSNAVRLLSKDIEVSGANDTWALQEFACDLRQHEVDAIVVYPSAPDLPSPHLVLQRLGV